MKHFSPTVALGLLGLAAGCGSPESHTQPDVTLSVHRNLGLIGIDIDMQRHTEPFDQRPALSISVMWPFEEAADYLKIGWGTQPGIVGKHVVAIGAPKPARGYNICAGNGVACLSWRAPSMQQQFKNELSERGDSTYTCYFRRDTLGAAVATELDVTLSANILAGRYPSYDDVDPNVGALELIGPDRRSIGGFVATFPSAYYPADGYGGLRGVNQDGGKYPAGLLVDCR